MSDVLRYLPPIEYAPLYLVIAASVIAFFVFMQGATPQKPYQWGDPPIKRDVGGKGDLGFFIGMAGFLLLMCWMIAAS
jgi:hypothetical protein